MLAFQVFDGGCSRQDTAYVGSKVGRDQAERGSSNALEC
jgi:hypothetical protein